MKSSTSHLPPLNNQNTNKFDGQKQGQANNNITYDNNRNQSNSSDSNVMNEKTQQAPATARPNALDIAQNVNALTTKNTTKPNHSARVHHPEKQSQNPAPRSKLPKLKKAPAS